MGVDSYYRQARTVMLDFIPEGTKRVADVGCGEGCFGEQLKSKGIEVWGVELNPEAAEIAKKRLDKVISGDICGILDHLPDHHFDCIVFNDVLEHLPDPFSLLRDIKSKLSAQGVVVC